MSNAAYRMSHDSLEEISDEEWGYIEPAEPAPVEVLPACDDGSYSSGARVPVTAAARSCSGAQSVAA